MISVRGAKDDYAIMRQVQQIKLAYPGMAIGTLDANADFSRLGPGETLFLVGHGDRLSGDLNDIDRGDLLAWLEDGGRGVPLKFGGIVICACHTGLDIIGGLHSKSLAHDIAQALKGKAAEGTAVAGANGYSFGTPEFAKSGRSSVLRKELRDFYTFAEDRMAGAWPKANPTHTGGVLETRWKIQVSTNRTIQQNLDTSQPRIAPDDVKAQLADFAKEGRQLEDQLKAAIAQVGGDSVATRAETLITGGTAAVDSWNQAIARQYALYEEYYLWASGQEAFTVVPVPPA
jgi:hypothetical protein